ncbi:MAG: hypothetical protein J6X18_10385 [Bacteroidales bacterium]|nr:hypothetical protein [Bacteroidales bacterium]
MNDFDVVYFVKNAPINEELRYSLRSVDANFPHRKVWIYGGKPSDIEPDVFVSVRQVGLTKWEKVRNMLRLVCENKSITEDFWLFNDDFFVNQKPTDFQPIYDGSIYKRIVQIESRNYDKPSPYTAQLRQMVKELERRCPDSPMNNYAVHFPMLVNREKMMTILNRFQSPMFRVLYGNYWDIGGVDMKDMKILRNSGVPDDALYLSSDDSSFMTREIGRYIRKKFNQKSRFEK